MGRRGAGQINFPATGEHRRRLAAMARLLGEPQAEVLRRCIDDLWSSLPKSTQRRLLRALEPEPIRRKP